MQRMRTTRGAVCLMVMLVGGGAYGEESAPAHPSWVYPCPRAVEPPTIDGRLDDDAYRHAPIAGGVVDYHHPSRYIKPTTTFQVVYDDATLYFAFHCEEPQIQELEQREPRGRDAVAAIGETIEIFLDLNHDHDNYHQWIVSLNRDLYDGQRLDKSWDSEVRFAVHRGKAHWGMEIAIPLKQIGLEKPLEAWQVVGFRVCRNRWRSLDSGRWWSSWSAGGFHDAASYDHLVITDEQGNLPDAKREALMPVFRWENTMKTGPVLVAASSGPNGETFAELGHREADHLEARVAELEAAVATLRRHAATLRAATDALYDRAPNLNAGTYPVFSLDVDRAIATTEAAFWASRREALVKMLKEGGKNEE